MFFRSPLNTSLNYQCFMKPSVMNCGDEFLYNQHELTKISDYLYDYKSDPTCNEVFEMLQTLLTDTHPKTTHQRTYSKIIAMQKQLEDKKNEPSSLLREGAFQYAIHFIKNNVPNLANINQALHQLVNEQINKKHINKY